MLRRFSLIAFSIGLGLLAVGVCLRLGLATPTARAAPTTDIIVTTTIQAAIDVAQPGDTVIVPAGVYTESLNLDKAVSLQGALSSTTIVMALPNQRAITITGATITPSVIISGLTFRDGNVAGEGGGLWITDSAQPLLQNLILQNNTASGLGGGLYADSGITLTGVQLMSNTATSGGGAWVASGDVNFNNGRLELNTANDAGGLRVDNGSLWLTDTLVLSNTALTQNSGGVWASGALTASDGVFQNNFGAGNGGGFYAGETATLSGTQFISNTANGSGGGGYVAGTSMAWVTDTVFMSNTAQSGGGLWLNGGGMVSGAAFQDNTVSNNGGGLNVTGPLTIVGGARFINNRAGVGGAVSQSAGSVLVINALFARNKATGLGNALSLNANVTATTITIRYTTVASPTQASGSAIVIFGTSGSTTISNTIVMNQSTGIHRLGSSVNEDYNLFFGNTRNTFGSIASGGQSLTANPAFVDMVNNDYHLTPASAALDVGIDTGIAVDFESEPRPQGGGFDMGWDESPYTATPDLIVTKTVTPAFAVAGSPITYTIAFSNAGPVGYNVVITDLVPGELISPTVVNTGAVITPTGGITYAWQAGTLLPGAGGLITLTGIVSAPTGIFTNMVEITATNDDLNPIDNVDETPFNVTSPTTPPSLSDTPDKTGYVGIPLTFTVIVSDAETALINLILTGSSSDQTRVPDANIVIGPGNTEAEHIVTITPALAGQATITLVVTDGDFATASDTFVLTVETEQPKVYLPVIWR